MTKEETTTVTITSRAKAGGKYWPEGKCDVPVSLIDALREAGVLGDPVGAEDAPEAEPEVKAEPAKGKAPTKAKAEPEKAEPAKDSGSGTPAAG